MNNEEKIKIGVDIEGNAQDVLKTLQKSLKGFENDLKRLRGIGTAITGASGGKKGDDSDALAGSQVRLDRFAMKGFRARMTFQGRMTRQRLAEEGDAARAARRTATEAAKTEESRVRTAARNIRYLAGLHRRYQEQQRQERATLRASASDWGRSALRRTRDVGSQVRRSAERTAVGAAVVGGGAMRKIVRSEADVDASEVDARIYGGLSRDAARKLRNDWAAPLAEQLGSTTSRMLSGYTEALKVGIPNEGAKAFSGLAVKTSEAWGLDISDVTDTLGTINQILTSAGDAFNFDKIKSVANSVQYLSAKQATTPGKLVEYLKRGAGGAQVLGMSQEAGLAFGSASTSLGNRAGTSGELMDFLASRVIELPKLAKRKGIEAQDARRLASVLGYGSADAMDRMRRRDPDAFLPDLVERFAKIRDPKKKDQAIRDFAGREWMGEFGRMVTGHETYKESVKLQREAKSFDAIEEAWSLHTKKLTFIGKQLKAGFLNFLGEFGQTLTPFAEQIKNYFLAWSDKLRGGGIGERFKAAIGGFIEGLGFKDLPDLLKGVFGEPGQGDAGGIEAWRETFRGFGAGIRDIADAVRQFFRALAGVNAGPEELGRWAGRFVALGGTLLVLSPVLGIMTALASGFLAVAAAVVSAWSTMKLAGLVGGATAGARAGALAGGATAGGAALPLLGGAALTAAIGEWFRQNLPDFTKNRADGIREDQSRGWMGRAWNWMTNRSDRQEPASRAIVDLPPEIQRLNDEIDRLRNQLDGDARVHRQSFDSSPSLRSMTQTAALSSMSDRLGGLVQLASLGGGLGSALGSLSNNGAGSGTGGGGGGSFGGSGSGPLLGNQTPGGALGNVGIGRRGIIGGGTNPSGMPDPGSGAGAGPYRGLLDHIARSEGTANQPGGGYNTSLGYGRYLPGGREQNLTGMSLNQILALGDHMRRQPGNPNSSALGRYQIVGNTLRGLMRRLNLSGNERFDEAMQDRLGAELARGRGANPQGLANEWASLRGARLQEAVRLAQGIPRGASTTPGARGPGDVAGQVNAQAGAVGAAVNTSGAAGAVDVAQQYLGMHENRNYSQLRRFMGTEIRGAQNAWCADFVNSSLRAVGMQGTNSRTANSFLGWGQGVNAQDAQRGDVLVEHRGRGLNGRGGHVGMATGRQRTNARGELELEMISGNYSEAVGRSWERASRLAVRRAAETGEMARRAMVPNVPAGAQQGNQAQGVSQTMPSGRMNPEEATRNVPLEPSRTDPSLGRRADAGGGGSTGGGGPQIHINGFNGDPEALANAVQRRLSERMGRRTHEVEHHWR